MKQAEDVSGMIVLNASFTKTRLAGKRMQRRLSQVCSKSDMQALATKRMVEEKEIL